MHGTVSGPVADSQRESLAAVHQSYDMHAHFQHGSRQSQRLTEDVIDAFSIAGPVSYCLERLDELFALGIRRFYLIGPGIGAEREVAVASHRRIVEHILPARLG
jgi:hypothetical protein